MDQFAEALKISVPILEGAQGHIRQYRSLEDDWWSRWLIAILVRTMVVDGTYSPGEEAALATVGAALGYTDVFDVATLNQIATQVTDDDVVRPLRIAHQVERLHGDVGVTHSLCYVALWLSSSVAHLDGHLAHEEALWFMDLHEWIKAEFGWDILSEVQSNGAPTGDKVGGVWM